MGKVANGKRHRASKSYTDGLLKCGMNVLQDSLSLIRERKKTTSRRRNVQRQDTLTLNDEDQPCTSKRAVVTGMSMHCLIVDDGLDGRNDNFGDSDSSIEVVRDLSCGSPALYDVLNVPSIVISKVEDKEVPSILENTSHLNIKHSTMNQSDIEAQISDMENLSPITKSNKKKKKVKLLDPGSIPSENCSSDSSVEVEYRATGKTPSHIRKVLSKLRSVGSRKCEKLTSSPILDINQNSVRHEAKVDTDGDRDSLDGQNSPDWSPSGMKRPSLVENWLEHRESEPITKSYLRCKKILPEWKKCIQKPLGNIDERSFRTSSPSPQTANQTVGKKTSLLQVSSIYGCTDDVSIDLNYESCPKITINSDEIAPFSTSSLHPNSESAEPTPTGRHVLSTPESPGEDEEVEVKNGEQGSVPGLLSRQEVITDGPAVGLSPHNCSPMSDELCHLPSPVRVVRHTGVKAPVRADIQVDEICSWN